MIKKKIRSVIFFTLLMMLTLLTSCSALLESLSSTSEDTEEGVEAPYLSALSISSGNLSPSFNKSTTSYTVSVSYDITSVTVTAATTANGATITVNSTEVTSGTASGAIDLAVGSNTISIVTYSSNKVESINYTITVTRASSTSTTTSDDGDDGDPADDDADYNLSESYYATSVSTDASTYDSADLVANTSFSSVVTVDFSDTTVQLGSATAQSITSSGTAVTSAITVAQSTYGITITSTATTPVKYILTGTLAGTLTVSSSAEYQLYLDGVTITGSDGPAFNLTSKTKVFIVSASGTSNTLSDSSTRADDMTMKAALYGKGAMIFSGEGTLTVTGNYKHGIFSSDYIRVCEGALNVNVTARDAIRSVNGFIFDDGTLVVKATGTTSDDESKGIKVEGSEDNPGEGYVVINGGYITITSVSKGITASWDIDDDAETTATSDDPDPYVEINNGVIKVTTTGESYENSDGTSCSPEGIEGKSSLTVNSGYLIISTDDDCLNAGDSIVINGGCIYATATSNDAIDSNGTLTITGGIIVAAGATAPEEAFDCDNNTFTITGGTLVGVAGATSTPTSNTCTQNVLILGSGTKGKTMAIKNSSGTVVFAFTIPQNYQTMVASSPLFEKGTYSVYTGGTATADDTFNGLFLGDISYANGSSNKTFTISSAVTTVR